MPTHEEVARGFAKGPNSSSSKRGSVNNQRRLDVFKERVAQGSADWGNATPERLAAVVVAITALGGAVTFGLSRNQGAYSCTLLLDDTRETLWFNGDADLDAELEKVEAMLATI